MTESLRLAPLHYLIISSSAGDSDKATASEGVRLLLEKGASPDVMDQFGNQPALFMKNIGYTDAANLLKRASAKHAAERRRAMSGRRMEIACAPPATLMEQAAKARAAEDALLAELEAEEEAAAAKRKAKKEKKAKKKEGKEGGAGEAPGVQSVAAALECMSMQEGEGVQTLGMVAGGGKKTGQRSEKKKKK